RSDAAHPGGRAERRCERAHRPPICGPRVALAQSRDLAPDTEAELVHIARVKTELAERNAKLRNPSLGIDLRRGVPHTVPRDVFGVVRVNRVVELHARGIDHELD